MVAKTRRPHRKSRNGCAECKQRHIRCDEHKPSCANCVAAERTCSFVKPPAAKQKQKHKTLHRTTQQEQQQQLLDTTPEIIADLDLDTSSDINTITTVNAGQIDLLSPGTELQSVQTGLDQSRGQLSHRSIETHNSQPSTNDLNTNSQHNPSPASQIQSSNAPTPPADCCPGLPNVADAISEATFNSQHMILMHHAHTVPSFSRPNRSAVDIAVRHAVDSPYLLDEVLAFTAFHMSNLYPGSAVYLRQLATELQNRALVSFTQLTKMVPNDDEATAVPRFLFSGILGRHVLAETLTYCGTDFHFFIDRFVECINLNRGIRAVTPPAWAFLFKSELRPMMQVVRQAEEKIIAPGDECEPLSRVMDGSDLNEVSVTACRQAIEVLQWSFDLCRNLDEEDYPQAASAFSVRIGAGFVDVLRKHRPEGLLILAYFGVVLYRCRSFWAFGDAGAAMIRAIAERLGTYWQEALAWPLHVIETEHTASRSH